jgi:hypothetical protein
VQTKKGKHKLSLASSGPYLVAEVLQPGAYRLQEINGTMFPNAWNIEQLRKFYPWFFFTLYFLSLLFLSSPSGATMAIVTVGR